MSRTREEKNQRQCAMQRLGIDSFWQIRIVISGQATFYLASRTRPIIHYSPCGRKVTGMDAHCLIDTPLGDTCLFLDWEHVSAVTYKEVFE